MNKPRILIVDDVTSNIHLLSNMLKDEYSIIVAKNGTKALELCSKDQKPDLILLDIVMPEMDGFEVCKKLKENQETQHIPIVFVSSLNEISEQELAIEAGGEDYIFKPVSKTILFHKIELLLGRKNIQNTQNIKQFQKVDTAMHRKGKILIVDDTPENLQVAIEILKADYSVVVAKSGIKALEIIQDSPDIDLILLDVIMPEMNGFEVCRKIKSNDAFSHIPVVFVTILENEKDIIEGFNLGATDYVVKPFEPEILKVRVKNHIDLKLHQDELKENIKQKELLLLKQSKLATLGEMFESITHQWKQPLSVISMSNANIRVESELDTLTSQKLEQFLNDIDNSTTHLSETIDVFRDFLEEDIKNQYLNLKELINKTIRLLESKIKNRTIEVKCDLEDIEVCTRKNDLVQVLMNLLSNSINALEKIETHRYIHISASVHNDTVTVSVCDNAGGIPHEYQNKIFDKYFTTKKDKKGSGIGLYIVKTIVEKNLKGNVSNHNTEDGTCFKISFQNSKSV